MSHNPFVPSWASSEEERGEQQTFRFQLFGREMGFLVDSDCTDGLDRDVFEQYSDHLLVRDRSGTLVATSRLTYANPVGGSYTELFYELPPLGVPREQVAEINRLGLTRALQGSQEGQQALLTGFSALLGRARELGITACIAALRPTSRGFLERQRIPFQVLAPQATRRYTGYYARFFDPDLVTPMLIHTREFASWLERNLACQEA